MSNLHTASPIQPHTPPTSAELDLRGVLCPYNFIKTKLRLETMDTGATLSILIDDGEPIRNVPRSVLEDGHVILSQEKVGDGFRVVIRKR